MRTTLARTVTIALVAGAVVARFWGGWARWPIATLVMLWPSLGGHYLELWFLNWLRPRLPMARPVQVGARVAVWFIGGVAFVVCMCLTALALVGSPIAPAWWLGGLAFIGIELLVHLAPTVRGRPSFYNGRG